MVGGIEGDIAGAKHAAGKGVLFVEGANFDSLLVGENGKVDGIGEVVFSELEGSAHVDDAGEFLQGVGEGNSFEVLHRVVSLCHGLESEPILRQVM